jgi:hypothetical protein
MYEINYTAEEEAYRFGIFKISLAELDANNTEAAKLGMGDRSWEWARSADRTEAERNNP